MTRIVRVTVHIDFIGDYSGRAQAVESRLLEMEDVANIDVVEEDVTDEIDPKGIKIDTATREG